MMAQVKRLPCPVATIGLAVLVASSLLAQGKPLSPSDAVTPSSGSGAAIYVARQTQKCSDAGGCYTSLLKAEP